MCWPNTYLLLYNVVHELQHTPKCSTWEKITKLSTIIIIIILSGGCAKPQIVFTTILIIP